MNQAFEFQKSAEKFLLFMNFRNDRLPGIDGSCGYLSDCWKDWFRKWLDRTVKAYSAAGISNQQVFLYPYDEMAGTEVDQFIDFAQWVRREHPGIKLYATLDARGPKRALPYLDIAQVFNDDKALKKVGDSVTELWLYDTKGPAKSLSPYAYYRMMSWKAFLHGYKGVGFWAYADTGWGDKPGTAWDDFDGERADYAVIYEGKGNDIISSRRWEAWRMGIEDYELLTMYAKAKGEKAAKDLAASVFNHPEDTTKADEARRKILTELSAVNN
jgi:hypothetical protein